MYRNLSAFFQNHYIPQFSTSEHHYGKRYKKPDPALPKRISNHLGDRGEGNVRTKSDGETNHGWYQQAASPVSSVSSLEVQSQMMCGKIFPVALIFTV
jgi:hypothetical protein